MLLIMVASLCMGVCAALLALRLILRSNYRVVWSLFAAAFATQAFRRAYGLAVYVQASDRFSGSLVDQVVALLISSILLAAIALAGPMLAAIKRDHEQLQRLLEQKETVVREVLHRVKNNMTLVNSLLHLQSSALTDQAAIAALEDSEARLRTVALINEQLSEAGEHVHVDLADYVPTLVHTLLDSFLADRSRVQAQISVPHLLIDSKRAVSCGLILNELVTNALKHAFPGNRAGTVQVKVLRTDDPAHGEQSVHGEQSGPGEQSAHGERSVQAGQPAHLRLVFSDDGVGLPSEFDLRAAHSLGMQLVGSLVSQLGGTVRFERRTGDGGTVVTIEC